MSDALHVLEVTPNVQIARYRALFVAVWTGPVTAPAVALLGDRLRELATESAGGVAVLSVLDGRYGLPDDAARAQAAALMRQVGGAVRAGAWVLEGRGAGRVAVRTVLAGMFALARRSATVRVFESIPGAVAWLLGPMGRAGEAEALAASVEQLRRAPIFYS